MSLRQDWLEYLQETKEDLALNVPPFDDIDPALLLQVLVWKGMPIPASVRAYLRAAEVPSADELEFIGDAVLHIIFTMSVAEHPLTVGQMSELRSQLERNSNLFIYASELELCERQKRITMKSCADIFEALIGALYIHLFYGKHMGYQSLMYIEDWLRHLGYEEMLARLIRT